MGIEEREQFKVYIVFVTIEYRVILPLTGVTLSAEYKGLQECSFCTIFLQYA